MTCEEDIEVASVRDEDNEEPDEEKAGVLFLGAIDEQEGAGQREEDAKENLGMKKDQRAGNLFQEYARPVGSVAQRSQCPGSPHTG